MKSLIAALFLILSAATSAHAADVVGRWKTIDDETGKAKSIVQIFSDAGEIKGKIVKLINPDPKRLNCTKCKGPRKNKPIVGMEILWGMKKKKDDEWKGGEILDPKNGKTYSCRLRLKDDGKKLEVRGYIGFSLFGRSQMWLREKAD